MLIHLYYKTPFYNWQIYFSSWKYFYPYTQLWIKYTKGQVWPYSFLIYPLGSSQLLRKLLFFFLQPALFYHWFSSNERLKLMFYHYQLLIKTTTKNLVCHHASSSIDMFFPKFMYKLHYFLDTESAEGEVIGLVYWL